MLGPTFFSAQFLTSAPSRFHLSDQARSTPILTADIPSVESRIEVTHERLFSHLDAFWQLAPRHRVYRWRWISPARYDRRDAQVALRQTRSAPRLAKPLGPDAPRRRPEHSHRQPRQLLHRRDPGPS